MGILDTNSREQFSVAHFNGMSTVSKKMRQRHLMISLESYRSLERTKFKVTTEKVLSNPGGSPFPSLSY
jgi:hypothetical protein